jgi:ABC-type sugar transport system ATPase subunit
VSCRVSKPSRPLALPLIRQRRRDVLARDEPAVAVRDLRKAYADVEAVRGVTFEVRRGEIFALLGPNGAGKTSVIEMLEGYRR